MVKRDLITYIIMATLLVFGLIALRIWFFEPVTITQQMANEYVRENDVIIAAKEGEIHYGDLVLYQVENKAYVGRVIAKEKDSIIYMDDVLYRNNEIVEESYLPNQPHMEYFTEDLTIATLTGEESNQVGEGKYLVLNDDRLDKEDSRTFGLISEQQIIGRLTFRISPLNEFGFVDTGMPQ